MQVTPLLLLCSTSDMQHDITVGLGWQMIGSQDEMPHPLLTKINDGYYTIHVCVLANAVVKGMLK